jgi:hypothetical protein
MDQMEAIFGVIAKGSRRQGRYPKAPQFREFKGEAQVVDHLLFQYQNVIILEA